MYKKLDVDTNGVLGYEISGSVGDEAYETASAEIQEAIETHGSVNLLVRMPDTPDAEVDDGDPLDFLFEHDDHIGRLAVVGDDRRVTWLARLGKARISSMVKRFDPDDEDDARLWVGA